jgi:hypothetical protein
MYENVNADVSKWINCTLIKYEKASNQELREYFLNSGLTPIFVEHILQHREEFIQ